MKSEFPQGFYVDRYGNLRPDRRVSNDRRAKQPRDSAEQERRRMYRRAVDRVRLEHDHKVQIKEALEDFAEEHGGRL